jgi:shikimate dehydrogenase
MHTAALTQMARSEPRFADWTYRRFDVPPEELPAALNTLHALGFRGLNLTVPHKIIAFDCVHSVDPAAQPIGAVNTLLWTPEGWHGYNTDGYGLATAVAEELGRPISGARILLLGAGGAARGAAVECLQQRCTELWIANRSADNLRQLLALIAPLADGVPVYGFNPQHPPAGLPDDLLIINATSAGLRPDDPLPFDLTRVRHPAGVYDMIYNPPQTRLLAAAAAQGVPHANGLSMLVHQGARSLAIWSGVSVPVDAMRTAARRALGL